MNRSVILILFLSLLSCAEPSSILSDFGKPVDIVGEEIQVDFSSVAFPNYNLVKISDYLVFADSKSEYWIKIIDLNNPEKVLGFGRKGRGPYEITFVYNLGKYPGLKNSFFINDAPNKQILIYCLDSLISGKIGADKTIGTGDKAMIRNIYPLSEERLIGANIESRSNYLALYNKEFEIISEELNYPDEMRKQLELLNINSLTAAFSPGLCFNPDKLVLSAILQNSDFLEIISLDSDTLNSVYRSYSYLPELRVTSSFRYTYSDIRGGILNACCTEKYIYCLAHDNSEKLALDDFRKGQRNVFIFNWDGTPERSVRLDRNVFLLTVDENDSILYAFTYGEEELSLLKYDL